MFLTKKHVMADPFYTKKHYFTSPLLFTAVMYGPVPTLLQTSLYKQIARPCGVAEVVVPDERGVTGTLMSGVPGVNDYCSVA